MNTNPRGRNPYKWAIVCLAVLTVAGLALGIASRNGFLSGQSSPTPSRRVNTGVFTPAHSSIGEAARHFFGMRREPRQPIAYTHQLHIQKVKLSCDYCHANVATGPIATIPSITVCMDCHESVATDRPEIQRLTEYQTRGEEVPWQRVYGWTDEAHVRFNHAPHIRAKVGCETCHGDLSQMTVAQRVVEHTMGFCVNCHTQRQAPNDCMTCHY